VTRASTFPSTRSFAGRSADVQGERTMPASTNADYSKRLQECPVIRNVGDLEAAEAEVIRRVKELHGEQHEPGAVWVRETALKLLAERSGEGVKP